MREFGDAGGDFFLCGERDKGSVKRVAGQGERGA